MYIKLYCKPFKENRAANKQYAYSKPKWIVARQVLRGVKVVVHYIRYRQNLGLKGKLLLLQQKYRA